MLCYLDQPFTWYSEHYCLLWPCKIIHGQVMFILLVVMQYYKQLTEICKFKKNLLNLSEFISLVSYWLLCSYLIEVFGVGRVLLDYWGASLSFLHIPNIRVKIYLKWAQKVPPNACPPSPQYPNLGTSSWVRSYYDWRYRKNCSIIESIEWGHIMTG